MPTIIRYPGVIEPESVSDAPAVGMDLFVTLTAIGGGDVPADRGIDGVDLRPLWTNGQLPDRSLFWALDAVSDLEFALRSGPWKLLLDRQQTPRELYNLADDPLELFNLIDAEGGRVESLAREAADVIAEIANDPLRPQQGAVSTYQE